MAKAANEIITKLEALLAKAADELSHVVEKTMFGCRGLFAKDSIFSLVWKEGRIGVKLPDKEIFGKLISEKGAHPWVAGNRKMSHWVLVPESMHDNHADLARWVAKAHSYAMAGTKKSQSPKKVSKRPAPRAAVKSRAAARPTTKMARVRRKSRSR